MEMQEVGEAGLIASQYNCRSLLLALSTVDSTTPENWFLYPDSSKSVSYLGAIDNPAQRIADHNRCLTLITMAIVLGTITNSHIPLSALQ